MPSAARILVIVLVLSGLFVGIASLRKGQVEGALTLKATAALLDAVPELRKEADWKVSFINTEGIVHGKIGSRKLLEQTAAAIARIQRAEVPGLESVSNLYNGLHFSEPASLALWTLPSGSIRLEGLVTASFADQLRSVLHDAVTDGANIDDRLEVQRELSSISWGEALLAYLPDFFDQAKGCRLTIADNRVSLGGGVVSEIEKKRLGALTVSHLGTAFSVFENRLGVSSDRQPAFATVLFVAPDSLNVSGALPTVAAKAALLANLKAIIPGKIKLHEDVQIDGSLADGDWYEHLANATRKLFNYAQTAKVEVKGRTVTTVIEANSERGQREISQALVSFFPQSDYELNSNLQLAEGGALRVVAAENEPVTAARMVPVSMPSSPVFSSSTDLELKKSIEDSVIYFKINSAMLGTENITTLKKLGKSLAASKSNGVILRGFTDQWGDAKLNQELAAFRCRSVRKILVMHGVSDDQVKIEPWSEALVSSATNEPSWKKRRVEMKLLPIQSLTSTDRGYELRKPGLTAAPAATPIVDSIGAEQLDEAVVYFGINSFALRRSERTKLRTVSRVVGENPSKEVVISGFCDKWGNAEYNLYLSKKRCETVRSYLAALGIDLERLVVEENGNEGAAEETGPSWKKRRVEFRLRDSQRLGLL